MLGKLFLEFIGVFKVLLIRLNVCGLICWVIEDELIIGMLIVYFKFY